MMMISEMIAELAKIKAQFGDVKVLVYCDDNSTLLPVEAVYSVFDAEDFKEVAVIGV